MHILQCIYLCEHLPVFAGMSEKEKEIMKKLEDLVDKQRDEIRAKDHELTLRNEDVEAVSFTSACVTSFCSQRRY